MIKTTAETAEAVTGTAAELAEKLGSSPLEMSTVLNFLRGKGQARIVGERKAANGKGRAAKVWELSATISIAIGGSGGGSGGQAKP